MPARPIVSDRQWEVLLEYMEEHPDMARGSVANEGPLAKKKNAEQWAELTSKLNCVGTGGTKTPDKWRDYWNNAKYAARKKACTRRQQAYQTGGGPMPKKLVQLTDREEKMLSLIGRVAVYGEETVRIPFDDLTNMPSTSNATASPPPSFRDVTVDGTYSAPDSDSEVELAQEPPQDLIPPPPEFVPPPSAPPPPRPASQSKMEQTVSLQNSNKI